MVVGTEVLGSTLSSIVSARPYQVYHALAPRNPLPNPLEPNSSFFPPACKRPEDVARIPIGPALHRDAVTAHPPERRWDGARLVQVGFGEGGGDRLGRCAASGNNARVGGGIGSSDKLVASSSSSSAAAAASTTAAAATVAAASPPPGAQASGVAVASAIGRDGGAPSRAR